MKVTVNIDCTPQEARAFFGLPDLGPMQEAILKQAQEKIMANMNALDPQELMRNWGPSSLQGMEQLQQAFWNNLASMAGVAKK